MEKVLVSDGSTWNLYDVYFLSLPSTGEMFCFDSRGHGFIWVAGKEHMSQTKTLFNSDV